ncbi:MAG: glycosyltransferase [Acetobacteraceae bacterium]
MTAMVSEHARDIPAINPAPMRILFVSYWFPPTNVVGAVRAGKFARYMRDAGHDLRVLAGPARDPLGLMLEIPEAAVSRPEVARHEPPTVRFAAAGSKLRERSDAWGLTSGRIGKKLREHVYAAREIPDKQCGWIEPAVVLGRGLTRDWRPDLIVASAPPYSGLMVAARLSDESGVPWIAEMRDPWSGNVYNDRPIWRDWLDRRMERRTLGRAAALVAVSPVVARDLGARYKQPIATVLNGFAPEDLPSPSVRAPHDVLTIVYTGTIYAGHRDPSPLFAAIARLAAEARRQVRVVFYGPTDTQVRALAAPYGIQEQIVVMPAVNYRTSLEHQADADVLLLLQRNHPSDEGNVPAKFFEYMGALRPILLLGYEQGVLARMIRERFAGLISNDPAAIAGQLQTWIAESRAEGVPALAEAARAGLSRAEQFGEYEAFLRARITEQTG